MGKFEISKGLEEPEELVEATGRFALYVPFWLSKATQTPSKKLFSIVGNVVLALREDPLWQGVFGWDDMKRKLMLRKPIPMEPWAREKKGVCFKQRPLRDADITQTLVWMQEVGMHLLQFDHVYKAVEMVARENSFHPCRDWLEGLIWDGKPRLDTWLSEFGGARASEYERLVGRMVLIAAVARAYEPGCKFDYMMILEGPQGARKSTACKVLGGEWFCENLDKDITSKDASMIIAGSWIVELGELTQMGKADTAELKHFVSKTVEEYRPPYGRLVVVEPRQCIFIGTTNEMEYLKDDTGQRRFWPVYTEAWKIEELAVARDQLFAEAVVAYKAGEKMYPDPEVEKKLFGTEQTNRLETDSWEARMEVWCRGKKTLRLPDLLLGCLQIPVKDHHAGNTRRAAGILRSKLGYASARDTKGNKCWKKV